MEVRSELEKERFITLFSPEDKINPSYPNIPLNEGSFRGKERSIPDLGKVALVGSRESDYSFGDGDFFGVAFFGVAIVEGQPVIKNAKELASMGLFEIIVDFSDLPTEEASLSCKVAYPQYGLSLESLVDVVKDIDEVWGFTNSWKVRDDDTELRFFAPADPEFLSQLQFYFHKALSPIRTDK